MTGRAGEEEHPGIKISGQELQTGARIETEAGAPEAEVTGETAARTGPLIEKIRAEVLPTRGDDAAAAARTATGLEKGGDRGVQNLPEETRVVPSPGTEEARPDPVVLKVKLETRARRTAPVPALTVTDLSFYMHLTNV